MTLPPCRYGLPAKSKFLLACTAMLLLSACRPPAITEDPYPQPIAPPADEQPVSYPPPVHAPTSTLTPSPSTTPLPAVIATQAPPAPVISLPCSPLAEHTLAELPEIVSDPYAPPPPGKEERHHGVDFSYYRRGERLSIEGVIVQTVFPGSVAASIQDRFPYGNMVIVESPLSDLPPEVIDRLGLTEGESLYTLYAHMGSLPTVAMGEEVAACQLIGTVGKSGNAGVPHLHLEMRRGPSGHQFKGMAFYSTQTNQEERDNYVLWRTSGTFQHFDPMLVLAPAEVP